MAENWHTVPHQWVRVDGPPTWRTCELCGTGPNSTVHRWFADQEKAQWRCRYSDTLTMLAHHGTVAEFEAAVRQEITDYRLDIEPDHVHYEALQRFVVDAGA